MAIVATLIEAESPERRGAERRPIARNSTIRELTGGEPHTVLVHDLSCEGLRLETSLDLAPGTELSIGLPGVGTRTVQVIRCEGGLYGCRFLTPVPPALLSEAFAASSVIEVPFTRAASFQQSPFPEPHVRKWHPAMRIGLMLGLGIAAWALLLHLLA
jgi:hypothetical protein